MIQKYIKTALTAYRGQTNGGIIYLFPGYAAKLTYLIPLMFLWSVLARSGVDVGMSLKQMLTYTYFSVLFADLLTVETVATSWCYEGELITLYLRPLPVFGHLIAQTVGGWLPKLLFFSLPLLIIAPLFGINVVPASVWFLPSLILCVSLGFAIDFMFACVTIRMRGLSWLAHVIRTAVNALLSGSVIPFIVLPFGLGRIFRYQPLGSLGGAPLSIFTGTAAPAEVILTQIFWNLVIWPLALLWFKKSKEKIVSFGG